MNSEGELIEPTQHFDFGKYGIADAAAQIDGSSNADHALPCSNTHGMKIWLNQEVAFDEDALRNAPALLSSRLQRLHRDRRHTH